jgi:hypothetical protein
MVADCRRRAVDDCQQFRAIAFMIIRVVQRSLLDLPDLVTTPNSSCSTICNACRVRRPGIRSDCRRPDVQYRQISHDSSAGGHTLRGTSYVTGNPGTRNQRREP